MTRPCKTGTAAGRVALATAVALVLTGCGGGSGGDGADGTGPVVTQTAGTGALITRPSVDAAVGDRWVYGVEGGGQLIEDVIGPVRIDGLDGLENRQVLTLPDGTSQTVTTATVRTDGGNLTHLLSGHSPLFAAFSPRRGLLPGPLRIGHREVLTQGPVAVAQDFDGDGLPDTASLRREFELLAVGERTTPAGTFPACVLRATTTTYTVFFSGGGPLATRTIRSSDWIAPGLGTVTSAGTTQDARAGSAPAESSFGYTLTGYRVGSLSGGVVD